MKTLQWYVLKVRSGKEEKIVAQLPLAFEKAHLQDCLGRTHAPFRHIYTLRGGKRLVKKRYFGYLVVEISLQNPKVKDTLTNIEGVAGFLSPSGWGNDEEPVPLRSQEVAKMLNEDEATQHDPSNAVLLFKEGESIEITDGPFRGNAALVKRVDPVNSKVEVVIQIFKKESLLQLNYNQIKKK